MSAEHPEVFDIWASVGRSYICIVHSVENTLVRYNIAFANHGGAENFSLEVFLERHMYVGNIKDNFLELEREILGFVRGTP